MSDESKIRVVIEGESSSLVDAGGKGKQAIAGLGQGTDKAAEKTRLFSGEGREMHRVISELNRISPMLGEHCASHSIQSAVPSPPP